MLKLITAGFRGASMFGLLSAFALFAAADTSACARVTDLDMAPRSQQLHFARIQKIDDRNVASPYGFAPQGEQHRLAPGKHILTISEEIDPRYFLSYSLSAHRARHKTIEVDVQADTKIYVAAKLLKSNTYDKNYWEPVVWKTKSVVCD
jgi:hypothetical protein